MAPRFSAPRSAAVWKSLIAPRRRNTFSSHPETPGMLHFWCLLTELVDAIKPSNLVTMIDEKIACKVPGPVMWRVPPSGLPNPLCTPMTSSPSTWRGNLPWNQYVLISAATLMSSMSPPCLYCSFVIPFVSSAWLVLFHFATLTSSADTGLSITLFVSGSSVSPGPSGVRHPSMVPDFARSFPTPARTSAMEFMFWPQSCVSLCDGVCRLANQFVALSLVPHSDATLRILAHIAPWWRDATPPCLYAPRSARTQLM